METTLSAQHALEVRDRLLRGKARVGEAVRSKRPDLALKEAETMFVQYTIMKEGGFR